MAIQRRLRSLSFTGSLIISLADLLSVYIIWQAFRDPKAQNAKRAVSPLIKTGGSTGDA